MSSANADLGGGGFDLQQLFWGPYFKGSFIRQMFLSTKKFFGKTMIYQANLLIFLCPKLIRTLRVHKRDKFLHDLSFASLIYGKFFAFCEEVSKGLFLFCVDLFLQNHPFTKFTKLNPCKNYTSNAQIFIYIRIVKRIIWLLEFWTKGIEINYCSR